MITLQTAKDNSSSVVDPGRRGRDADMDRMRNDQRFPSSIHLSSLDGGASMVRSIDFTEDKLSFPLRTESSAWGPVEVYLIPRGQKEAVLKKLYPFRPIPALDAVMEDIHAEKTFVVRDFMVTREGEMNVLASPYYLESGGSVIDWVPADEEEPEEDE
jgi:hypothetical protein